MLHLDPRLDDMAWADHGRPVQPRPLPEAPVGPARSTTVWDIDADVKIPNVLEDDLLPANAHAKTETHETSSESEVGEAGLRLIFQGRKDEPLKAPQVISTTTTATTRTAPPGEPPLLPRFQSVVTDNGWAAANNTAVIPPADPQRVVMGGYVHPGIYARDGHAQLRVAPPRPPLGIPDAMQYRPVPTMQTYGPASHGPASPTGAQVRRPRRYSHRVPSKYCHICQRKSDAVSHVVCKNISTGICRKAVCQVCFEDYGWDWEATQANPLQWMCPHCQGICPTRAQCYTYMRTNFRRRAGELSKRRRSEVYGCSDASPVTPDAKVRVVEQGLPNLSEVTFTGSPSNTPPPCTLVSPPGPGPLKGVETKDTDTFPPTPF